MGKRQKLKMVNVPLRLDGEVFRTMHEISHLCGFPVDTVVSVLVAVGFLRDERILAHSLKVYKAAKHGKKK